MDHICSFAEGRAVGEGSLVGKGWLQEDSLPSQGVAEHGVKAKVRAQGGQGVPKPHPLDTHWPLRKGQRVVHREPPP